MAATTEEVTRAYGRGTSFVVSDVDLVDVDLDVDHVDVDLVVFLSSGCFILSGLVAPGCILGFWPPAVPAVFWAGCFRASL